MISRDLLSGCVLLGLVAAPGCGVKSSNTVVSPNLSESDTSFEGDPEMNVEMPMESEAEAPEPADGTGRDRTC